MCLCVSSPDFVFRFIQEAFKFMSKKSVVRPDGVPQKWGFPYDFPSYLLMCLVYVPSDGPVEAVAVALDLHNRLMVTWTWISGLSDPYESLSG